MARRLIAADAISRPQRHLRPSSPPSPPVNVILEILSSPAVLQSPVTRARPHGAVRSRRAERRREQEEEVEEELRGGRGGDTWERERLGAITSRVQIL